VHGVQRRKAKEKKRGEKEKRRIRGGDIKRADIGQAAASQAWAANLSEKGEKVRSEESDTSKLVAESRGKRGSCDVEDYLPLPYRTGDDCERLQRATDQRRRLSS